ncbi:NXPE family member 3-like isoform X2 [Marmota flaviventris]|uniref:NXPE family member 3-like isoform X2 n=1 Tax=Marmota flaviventris TaxID=93162 RepID=UPI003A88DEE9
MSNKELQVSTGPYLRHFRWHKILVVVLAIVSWVLYFRIFWSGNSDPWPPKSPSADKDPTSLSLELPNLIHLLYWPLTPGDGGDLLASTSHKTSNYHLRGPAQDTYALGSYLEVVLVARDHRGRPKTHGGDLFQDEDSGEFWYCDQPPTLACSMLVGHSVGHYWNVTTSHEEALLAWNLTDKVLPQGIGPVHVARNTSRSLVLSPALPCYPGISTPKPSGFYHQDVWHSLACSNRPFPTVSSILGCLAGHIIHMMGDSTLRQWWEYLRDTVPSLKPVDLHSIYQVGPLMAVETTRGIVLHWRAHSWPLRSKRTPVASLHSVVRELGGLAGGPHTVVVLGLGAHFTTFPPSIFARRLAGIRAAVMALLEREPRTLVVIKLANTGYKSVYGSDWFTLHMNRLLRSAFAGLRVAFVDAWEMTSSLALPDNIHPGKLIVSNEVNLLLSFICPT